MSDEVEQSAEDGINTVLTLMPELREEVDIHLSHGRTYFEVYTALRDTLEKGLTSVADVKRRFGAWFNKETTSGR